VNRTICGEPAVIDFLMLRTIRNKIKSIQGTAGEASGEAAFIGVAEARMPVAATKERSPHRLTGLFQTTHDCPSARACPTGP
jgi:hypothetical protein